MNNLDYYLIYEISTYLDYKSKISFIKMDKYNYNNLKNLINYNIGNILKKKLKIIKFDLISKIRLNYYRFYFLKKISNILLNNNEKLKLKKISKFKLSKFYNNNLVYYNYLTINNVKSILSFKVKSKISLRIIDILEDLK